MRRLTDFCKEGFVKMNRSLFMQLTFVLLTFSLLAICSGIIMVSSLNRQLFNRANEVLCTTAASISQTMLEPEVTLDFIADAVKERLQRGDSFESIKAYMSMCSSSDFKDKHKMFDYYSVYGYFDIFEETEDYDVNAFYDGGGWTPYVDFLAKERPYYEAAIAAGGRVIVSDPYMDADSGTPVIAYARGLWNDDGELLGVICLDVPMNYIRKLVSREFASYGGYGVLWDQNQRLIIHPSNEMIGIPVRDIPGRIAELAPMIENGTDISLEKFTNYNGVRCIIFGKRLANGWYLGAAIPRSEYYKDLLNMIVVMSVLCVLPAAGLTVILVRLHKEKEDSEKATLEKEEQRKMLEEIAHKEQEANQLKSRFLANMSHEVRTPMNAILGITEIQLKNNHLSNETEEALREIHESGTLLLSIINDILDLSKIEAGKLDIIARKYELPNIINDAVRLNRFRYDNSSVKFLLEVDENTPLYMYGDDIRIRQILNNLLSNAFKYTEEGEVVLTVRSEDVAGDIEQNGVCDKKTMLVLTVRDTGIGMTQEQLDKLFIEYTRFVTKSARTITGAGLGLCITKHLVELMEGEMDIESRAGKGSEFTVRIPQKRVDLNVCGPERALSLRKFTYKNVVIPNIEKVVYKQMPEGSVLIVDDVFSNISVARGLMNPYGLKIDSVNNGKDAIKKIKSGETYDIIFMDYMMPKMNGVATTNALREMGYTGIIVALTASALVGQAEQFLSNGFDAYLSKPINSKELEKLLFKYIADKDVDIA